MDLLHHEMLESVLLGSGSIPVDNHLLFFDDITVKVIECCLSGFDACHLEISDIVNVAGILEDRGNIGSHIGSVLFNADDHRAVLAGNVDLSRMVLEHYCESI